MTGRLGSRVRSAAGWLLVAAVVFLAWPAQLGGHLSLVVVSGQSMDGTYGSNDLLLVWPHSDYDAGDIVVYQVPKGGAASGLRVVHRIIDEENGHFTTQGDNRPTADIWQPTTTDVVGRPFLRLPAGGLVLKWLLSPIALALLCAVCVYLAIVGRDSDAEESGSHDGGAGEAEIEAEARPVAEAAVSRPPSHLVSLVACQTITPYGGTGSAR